MYQVTYTGFARFSNVEFARAGQEGWYDNFDPRYALAYLNTGDSVDAGGAPGGLVGSRLRWLTLPLHQGSICWSSVEM